MKRLKGIHRDNDPIDQPQGTYRDALNAVLTKRKGAIASEEGTGTGLDISGTYPGHTIIGDASIFDGRQVLFLADSSDGSGNSVIATYKDGAITEIVSDSRLSFRNNSVLEAVTIINNQGQAVAYWTDNVNPPRFYNLDAAGADTIDDLNAIKIFTTVSASPVIDFNSVEATGGSLRTGAYHFGIRLIAEDDSTSAFMMFTPPVYINEDTDVTAHDSYDGAQSNTPTSKKIVMDVGNLDTNFDRFEIAVIKKQNDTVAGVDLLPEQNINSENTVFEYTGNEAVTQSSIEEVLINTASYETAKTIAEIDNTLYMGNLSQKADLGYQRYANNITVEAIEKDIQRGGSGLFTSDHYGNAEVSFYDKSFKRGEVYALYIAFVLEDGTESEAYHIPGRAPEGTELNDTSHPEFDAGIKEYQVESNAGTNNMAYWENQASSEVYPNTDDWDIYDVDGSGNPVDTLTSLRGEQIRHHHFPDFAAGYKHFQGLDTSDFGKTLGVKLSNIKIPASIIDRIRGVKVYYAERTPGNRRIIDQGMFLKGNTLLKFNDPDQGVYWSMTRGDNNQSTPFGVFNGFYSQRTRANVGSATHVKFIARPIGDITRDQGGGDNDRLFYPLFDNMEDISFADRFRKIKNGTAIAYLVPNELNNTTAFQFTYDTINIDGEESIAIEFNNDFTHNTNWGPDTNGSAGYIAEIFSVQDNLYSPFDLQNLVWTGVLETDISKFDPREGGATAATAEGTITVTAPADAQAGEYAQGSIKIDSLSGTGQSELQIDIGTNSVTTTSNFTDATPLSDIAIGVRDAINADPTLSAIWTASIDGGDNTKVNIIADSYDETLNGLTVTAVTVQESGALTINTITQDTSGGVDNEIIISFGAYDLEVVVNDSDTKDTIATAIRDAINADPTLSADYTATVDTVPTDPVVTITADATGSQYNTTISINTKSTGATFTDTDITGGVTGGVAGASILDNVYGGDTFIGAHSFRRTGYDHEQVFLGTFAGAEEHRHLVYYVGESQDNVKLRHEGEGNADIYYPKSSYTEVLRLEDDLLPDGEKYNNFIGYNTDYSSHADIKVPTPNLLDDDNITRFPTRIIRSLQGDTNVGEDEGLRTFLENDFIDLTRARGELTTLSVMDSILIPHMERAMIRTKGREEMLVGDIRAFVGAGDIFAVNPDEIISTKNGFAGLQDQRCATVTPYGYFFVDRDAGKVFLVGDSPKVISDSGLNNYFSDKLDAITAEDQLICTWDNKWDRIILSYKGDGVPADAWTISYYPEIDAWGSFHSYHPEYFFYDIDTFYAKEGDAIYKHNVEGNPCGYYGVDYNLEFDFIENRLPTESKVFGNIQFITDVEDTNGDVVFNESFDQYRVYNDLQDSGVKNATYFTGAGGNARNVEGTWKINDFRNMLVAGAVDPNKDERLQDRIRGKWAGVRLIFNNTDNKSLYLYDTDMGVRRSHR